MKRFFNIFFYIIIALYPVLIFTFLVILKLPVRIISLAVVALALTFFLSVTGKSKRSNGGKSSRFDWKPFLQATLFLAAGVTCFLTNQAIFLKLYSVVISAMLLIVFASTLIFSPNIIFRLATLQDKSIKGASRENLIEQYCKKVTIAWCVFFILNGSTAAFTAFFCSDKVWAIYSGGISYILMGLMFAVEFIIRKKVTKKMNQIYSITKFNASSRDDNFILCYEDTWQKGVYKTWKNFLEDSCKIRMFLQKQDALQTNGVQKWILHCEDYWYFLCTFVALLQCKKTVFLTQNISPEYIAEIKTEGVEFLSDQNAFSCHSIQSIIEDKEELKESDIKNTPRIVADETQIFMYTSGSTGKPKAVQQRMTEFEADNAFIISKWQNEFAKRKLVTTVSQHHIYGFLFGISLPFTLGVPFRRSRIEFPEEFEKLNDSSYMIIATPAFLKRTVETENSLPLNDCFIFSSGGAVSEELAVKIQKVFGFCPLEVYGSTETSGIAYRQQSKDGLIWTPFDNAKIWQGDDGCLVIISPYIKDPAGFATADLVEIFSDGKFMMKGRSDSIVKIEEKRISLTEVETRLMQSGLVKECKVIALEDVRQYLAAAIVLNESGAKKFENVRKLE
ncbi:MAG: AMP-binding protein, partial [Treponema sp.]|nr:AMP-binding protein [Treponema sp.]